MRNKQSGFAMIEIVILAVVGVGILGFIGWTAYNRGRFLTPKKPFNGYQSMLIWQSKVS